MATIRTRFRFLFATAITALLVACSGMIWFWANYLIDLQVNVLLERDAARLADEIVWKSDIDGFELRSSPLTLRHQIGSDYWQIRTADGQILWTSDSWSGYSGQLPQRGGRSELFTIPAPGKQREMYAYAQTVSEDRNPAHEALMSDFPPEVRSAVRRLAPNHNVVASGQGFSDDRLTYEVTARKGDDLLELDLDQQGNVLQQTMHRVPKALPAPVAETFGALYPQAKIESFDWRATEGRLEFIITARDAAGQSIRRGINSNGEVIPVYFPASRDAGPVRFELLVADEHSWRHGLRRQLGALLLIVCGSGLVAAWLISMWLAHQTLQPIGLIARKARLIDERRLSDRLTGGRSNDEIGLLVGAINGMLDRIENAFERQRRFARDASHELRGPLTGVIAQLELARGRASTPQQLAESLDQALERSQRLRDLVEKLLLLARQESDQPVNMRDDLDISECVENVVADFPAEQRQRIRVCTARRHGDGALPNADDGSPDEVDHFIRGNEELLHAMFRNVLENALKFSEPHTSVDVVVRYVDGAAVVEVTDLGQGIPAAARDQIFEPFVRLHDSERPRVAGSGLGLSIVRWVALLHQAQVSVRPGPNGVGTLFSIALPIAS
jgi:signal transduction histidine kinase